MYTRLTDNLWLLKKLLRYLYIYLPKLMDLSPIASNYRSSWIWNTYDIHAICDVYGEFVPPHLSLVLILQCTWSSAESINQLGQWKSQGHLHYSSWPTTMAQTNLRWNTGSTDFMGGVVNPSFGIERVDAASGSVLHIVTRISYVVDLLSNLYVHACPQMIQHNITFHGFQDTNLAWSCRLDWIGVHIDHARFQWY